MEKITAYKDLNGHLHSSKEYCEAEDKHILSGRRYTFRIKTIQEGMAEFVIKTSSGQDKGGYTQLDFVRKLSTIFSEPNMIRGLLKKLEESENKFYGQTLDNN